MNEDKTTEEETTKEETTKEVSCGADPTSLFVGVMLGLWAATVIWAIAQD